MPLNRPDASELLQAVSGYLSGPAEDPKADRFYRRVAANVLGIVERQWRLQADYEKRDADVVAILARELGADGSDNAALCRRLEEGVSGLQLRRALAELKPMARAKLEIDHPGYGG